MCTIINMHGKAYILVCRSLTSHGGRANITSSTRSLIIQLARIISFVGALNKHIKNIMEIVATGSNKVSIMSGN